MIKFKLKRNKFQIFDKSYTIVFH